MTMRPTAGLAGQMLSMVNFAAAPTPAALDRAWSAVRSQTFMPDRLSAITPAQLQREEGLDGPGTYRRVIVDEVRPLLDRSVMRFLDGHSQLTRSALRSEGFDSAEGAILLARRAQGLEVVSRDPSEALIASALTLILSSERSGAAGAAASSGQRPGIRLLDRDEKMRLLEAAKTGDPSAEEKLLVSYRPLLAGLVRTVRARMGLSSADAEDLLQLAGIKFMELVKSYDPERGAGFGPYAKRFILLHLLKTAADEFSSIYRPSGRRLKSIRIDGARWELRGRLGRNPHDDEVAERLGMGMERLREDHFERAALVSLSSPVFNGADLDFEGTISGSDSMTPEVALLELDLKDKLDRAIEDSGLSGVEISALRGIYLDGLTAREIGRALGFSGSMVNALVRSAVRKISTGPFADALTELLG